MRTIGTVTIATLGLAACCGPRHHGDTPTPPKGEHASVAAPPEVPGVTPPFSRHAYRLMQNLLSQREAYRQGPITREEYSEHVSRYRSLQPEFEQWAPPFDLNQDGVIDADEIEQARLNYAKYFEK